MPAHLSQIKLQCLYKQAKTNQRLYNTTNCLVHCKIQVKECTGYKVEKIDQEPQYKFRSFNLLYVFSMQTDQISQKRFHKYCTWKIITFVSTNVESGRWKVAQQQLSWQKVDQHEFVSSSTRSKESSSWSHVNKLIK